MYKRKQANECNSLEQEDNTYKIQNFLNVQLNTITTKAIESNDLGYTSDCIH